MPGVHENSGRLDRLEEIMMQLAYEHTKTEMALRGLKHEMSNFKREMQDFKDEMKDFKDEMRIFKDGVDDFKVEMRVFKDGVNDFKVEMRASKKENDRRWGDLANKMGTLGEDTMQVLNLEIWG